MDIRLVNGGQTKYTFKRLDWKRRVDERLLVCPNCTETLRQADIENYSRCPFCDYKLVLNGELEDFILEPLVEHWMKQQDAMAPDGHCEDGVSVCI